MKFHQGVAYRHTRVVETTSTQGGGEAHVKSMADCNNTHSARRTTRTAEQLFQWIRSPGIRISWSAAACTAASLHRRSGSFSSEVGFHGWNKFLGLPFSFSAFHFFSPSSLLSLFPPPSPLPPRLLPFPSVLFVRRGADKDRKYERIFRTARLTRLCSRGNSRQKVGRKYS